MTLLRRQVNVMTPIRKTFVVDETPTAPTGTLTATVKRLDGTSIAGSPFTYTVTGTECSFTPPGIAQVDTLVVEWSGTLAGSTGVIGQDVLEIVGGFYFGLAEARSKLNLSLTYSTDDLAEKRVAVEVECENIRRQAQVPRFMRRLLDGSGTDELVVPDMELRTLRAASVADQAGGTFVALSAGELAAVAAEPSGVLIRDDGSTWPRGHRNVIVEYEHGLDYPDPTIKDAAILRLRSMLATTKSNIPERAMSFTVAEGGTYRIATPTAKSTGIPDVDAAYQRDANERVWIA